MSHCAHAGEEYVLRWADPKCLLAMLAECPFRDTNGPGYGFYRKRLGIVFLHKLPKSKDSRVTFINGKFIRRV
jgi:hypothetical protein